MDIIIGGGVTGISYAAFTSNPYMLIEKEKECGGYGKRSVKEPREGGREGSAESGTG